MKKKAFFVFSILGLCLTSWSNVWATEDAKNLVINLVNDIQSIANNQSNSTYDQILPKYFDFNRISAKVLAGVRKKIKDTQGQDVADQQINNFLPKFIPVFTQYMLKKYSRPENIDKFKSMTFEIKNTSEEGNSISIISNFKTQNESKLSNIGVEWKVQGGLIVDMIFTDASASLFKNEASEAIASFAKTFNGKLEELPKAFDALLENYQ